MGEGFLRPIICIDLQRT
uniref:Uncharacterized protein n=1 Tax=Pyricularia oryzae (strain 70-15 / ATCC MYA-4617 / FGSC 8958) TaxID=242507 RepID=Q2KEE2_PYRO7|nr:hypothetical protein MGCH7_ch7g1094 [Pyricularia oryzae 70-15]